MAGAGTVAVFVMVFFYLIFASSLVSYIATEKDKQNIQTFDLGITQSTIVNSQDFTSDKTYFTNNVNIYGNWTQIPTIGLELVSLDTLYAANIVVEDNIMPDNGIYDVTYHINNSVHQPYAICIRFSKATGVLASDNLILTVDSMGYHLPHQFNTAIGNLLNVFFGNFWDYYDSNIMLEDYPTIRTVYDETNGILTIYHNDTQIAIIKDVWGKLPVLSALNTYYYAGVASNTVGFAWVQIDAKASSTKVSDSGLDYALNFLSSIFKVLFWTIDEQYLPLVPWNLILIKFPLTVLFVIGLVIARGGGG